MSTIRGRLPGNDYKKDDAGGITHEEVRQIIICQIRTEPAMKHFSYTPKKERILECIFYLSVFMFIAIFAIFQPLGDPPDEINRYKVAQYVSVHGTIPHGADPEVEIGGYGASYAFQPILPYMIQGYFMRLLLQFTENFYILTYAARFVNVLFGVLMAVFVRKIAKEVFDTPSMQWFFTLLVVFLPQNLFLHSYINTDSCAALSASIIIYACLKGLKDNFSTKTSVTLAVGIILCALSYYNAYGVILCSILLFLYSFLEYKDGKLRYRFQEMIQKACFISLMVLLGIGWWFIRNALLYDGDLLGMTARTNCAIQSALPEFNPLTKPTIQSTEGTLRFLFMETPFVSTLIESFIATFGTMDIKTFPFVYFGFKLLIVIGGIGFLIPLEKRTYLKELPESTTGVFNVVMIFDCIIPAALCVWYSYSWDYQPQGRYILPLLIPLMYLAATGCAKLFSILERYLPFGSKIASLLKAAAILFLLVSITATMLGEVLPHYAAIPNWWDASLAGFRLGGTGLQ